jgi:hypothetical protein
MGADLRVADHSTRQGARSGKREWRALGRMRVRQINWAAVNADESWPQKTILLAPREYTPGTLIEKDAEEV